MGQRVRITQNPIGVDPDNLVGHEGVIVDNGWPTYFQVKLDRDDSLHSDYWWRVFVEVEPDKLERA